MKTRLSICFALSLPVSVVLGIAESHACGNQMHAWITMRALDYVDSPGLKAFLDSGLAGAQGREFEAHLRNGTMFPDAGYAYRITNDTYAMSCPSEEGYEEREMVMKFGEIAHWEPFQQGYLEQFTQTYLLPGDSPESELEFAFLLGMASHGIADQVYDAVLMKGSKHHDKTTGWGPCEWGEPWPYEFSRPVYAPFDSASDIIWTAQEGDQDVPAVSFPGDALVATFEAGYEEFKARGLSDCEFSHFTETSHQSLPANQDGSELGIQSEELFWNGINLVGFGMELVKGWAEDETDLEQAKLFYPWAKERFEIPGSYGGPDSIARITARLWETVWAEASGDTTWQSNLIIGSFPGDNGFAHPISAASPTSNVSLVFARQLSDNQNFEEMIRWTDSDGNTVEFSAEHFYRANVLNLRPVADLALDTRYQIEFLADITLKNGLVAPAGTSIGFSTGEAPPEPEIPAASSSGCASTTGGHVVWLLGMLLWFLRSGYRRGCAE